MNPDKLHCSFCHRSQDDVLLLVAGPHHVNICDDCAAEAWSIVDPKRRAIAAAEAEYKSWGIA